MYERRDRHQDPNLYFIEFHDVSGNVQHKDSRSSMFYDDFDGKKSNFFIFKLWIISSIGIILVSDLTNRQSYDNLKEWLHEVIRYRSRQKLYE